MVPLHPLLADVRQRDVAYALARDEARRALRHAAATTAFHGWFQGQAKIYIRREAKTRRDEVRVGLALARVQKDARQRRDAMRERRRIAWAGREEAIVAVLRESAVLQARAQHVFVARVTRETAGVQRVCEAAHARCSA